MHYIYYIYALYVYIFVRFLLQLCRSRFRLINLEQKFRSGFQGTDGEKELLRT